MNRRLLAVLLLAAAAACSRGARPSAEAASARRALLDGASYYEKGDYALADRSWEDCLTKADPESGEASECRRRLERLLEERSRSAAVTTILLPTEPAVRRAPVVAEAKASGSDPKAAMQSYLEGVVYYQNGDRARARERWEFCAAMAGADRATGDDCRLGLDKLDASTALDGNK